jgi:hypothetical protein
MSIPLFTSLLLEIARDGVMPGARINEECRDLVKNDRRKIKRCKIQPTLIRLIYNTLDSSLIEWLVS